MPYAEADSALLGGIPVTSTEDLAAFFNDASDEIDATLGLIYETPITKDSEGNPLSRVTTLILARINRYLASGRFITAVAAAGEDNSMHAYGRNLINEARAALNNIVNGSVDLDAKRLPNPNDERRRPGIANAEAQSNVDAFYNSFTGNNVGQTPGMIFDPNFQKNIAEREAEWTRGW